ncbi:MAG: hypothetical protein WBN92_21010, partial [Terriglobia bacterium]
PEWVGAIEAAALDALQKAFKQFPVIVERAPLNTNLFWECVEDWKLPGCVKALGVNVAGFWPGDGATGETVGVTPHSFVYYWISLQNSETALGMNPVYTGTSVDIPAFAPLLQAIGTGIGNAAAHEVGHGIAYTVKHMNMDCNAPGNATGCQNGLTHLFEWDGGTDWEYTHVWPDIDWQPKSICAIQQYFNPGYRNQATGCTADYTK